MSHQKPTKSNKKLYFNKKPNLLNWLWTLIGIIIAICLTYYFTPKRINDNSKNEIISKLESLQKNDKAKFIIITDSLIKSLPNSYLGYYYKAKIIDNDTIKNQFIELAIQKPDIPINTLNYLGDSLNKINKFNLAALAYKSSISRKSNDSIHFELGKIYSNHIKDYKEAIIQFHTCLLIDSTYNQSYDFNEQMGIANLGSGNYDRSKMWFNKALNLKPSAGSPEYYLGKIYFINGNTELACDMWKKSVLKGSKLSEYAIETICN